MSVAIIVPAYNAQKYLAITLDSVLAQTVTDWELIIVDDGSTDRTLQIIADYCTRDSRIRLLQQKNAGAATARNTGSQAVKADTDYLMFLDADDLLEADALETLLEALVAHPDALGAHALGRIIDSEGRFDRVGELEAWGRDRQRVVGNRLHAVSVHEPTDFSVVAYINCIISPGAVLLRRSAFESTGPFDTALRNAEDWDMWLRMLVGGHFIFIDKCLFRYRKHADNKSSNHARSRASQLAIRYKLIANTSLNAAQRRIAVEGFRLGERHLLLERKEWTKASLRRGDIVDAAKHVRHALLNLKNMILISAGKPQRRSRI